jgi:type III restriction enzyme
MACERSRPASPAALLGTSAPSRRCSTRTTRWGSRRTSTSTPRRRPLGDQRRPHCHVNWVILDSDWEGRVLPRRRVAPAVKAYVKNHNLGLEVPYRYGSETRSTARLHRAGRRRPRRRDLLHLIVEIKGYRREDAKEKKATMDTYWVPGVNHLGTTAAGPSPSSATSTR